MPSIGRGLYRWLFHGGATLEDFADRLNHFWTCGLLIILACVISWKQGYSNPIQCWVPAEMTWQNTRYVSSLCWNSYLIRYPRDVEKAQIIFEKIYNFSMPLPFYLIDGDVPSVNNIDIDEMDSLPETMVSKRTLYQWLPLILVFQALLFKLPNILMYIFHGFSGISFDKLAGLTSGFASMQLNERENLGRQVGRYFYNWCDMMKLPLPWRLISLLWLGVKILYCVNIVIQMSLIDTFLTPRDPPYDNTTSYGDVVIGNLFHNNATIWNSSPSFPRHVMCDFGIRQFANIHHYTVQCFLPSNQFNEFVYMFIWVWLLFVAIVTCLSLAVWVFLTLVPIFRKRYITKAFSLSEDIEPRALAQQDFDRFCNFVGEDGVMALKLVAANTSELFVSKIVCSMWNLKMKGFAYLPSSHSMPASVPGTRQTVVPVQAHQPGGGLPEHGALYPGSEIKKIE